MTVNNSTTSGFLSMAQATAFSTNTYFMAIEERTGICRVAEIAESMGVYTGSGDELPRVPTLTLGVAEVTPLAMANAYATFAAHGVHCEPRSILEVRDRDQKRLPVPEEKCTQVIDRPVADSVTELLAGVVDGPIAGRTGSAMSLAPQPVAGKTGTTNESAAVWFAGYTPHVAAAVWIGDPRGGFAHPLKDITINGTYYRQVFGGTLAGPIWKASMEAALADKPIEEFVLSTDLPIVRLRGEREFPIITGMATREPRSFAALTKVNLELGEISEEDSPEPAGTVIAQTPESPGGTAVPRNSRGCHRRFHRVPRIQHRSGEPRRAGPRRHHHHGARRLHGNRDRSRGDRDGDTRARDAAIGSRRDGGAGGERRPLDRSYSAHTRAPARGAPARGAPARGAPARGAPAGNAAAGSAAART